MFLLTTDLVTRRKASQANFDETENCDWLQLVSESENKGESSQVYSYLFFVLISNFEPF